MIALNAIARVSKIQMTHKAMPVAFAGMLMFLVRVGKVVAAWNSFDFLKMFQQMGVVNLAGG